MKINKVFSTEPYTLYSIITTGHKFVDMFDHAGGQNKLLTGAEVQSLFPTDGVAILLSPLELPDGSDLPLVSYRLFRRTLLIGLADSDHPEKMVNLYQGIATWTSGGKPTMMNLVLATAGPGTSNDEAIALIGNIHSQNSSAVEKRKSDLQLAADRLAMSVPNQSLDMGLFSPQEEEQLTSSSVADRRGSKKKESGPDKSEEGGTVK